MLDQPWLVLGRIDPLGHRRVLHHVVAIGLHLVIERHGRTREVTGWRKWSIAVPVLAIVAPVVALAVLFILGLAVTVGAILIIALPLAVILALLFGRYEIRTSSE